MFSQTFFSNFKSHIAKAFNFNKNEGNYQKVEKVSGRVRVGREGLLRTVV